MAIDKFKYTYANEKAYLAVRSMALGNQSLKQRVIDAYIHNLTFIDPDEHGNLPLSVYSDFREIKKRLTQLGNVRDAVHSMTDDEVRELAHDILELTDRIRDIYVHPEDYADDYA